MRTVARCGVMFDDASVPDHGVGLFVVSNALPAHVDPVGSVTAISRTDAGRRPS